MKPLSPLPKSCSYLVTLGTSAWHVVPHRVDPTRRSGCPSRRVDPGGSLAAGARPAMVTMKSGVLVKCDGALKQFILHLDEQKQKEGAGADSFVLSGQEASELDETHLLVKEDALEYIQQAIEDMQAKNSFSRPDAAAQEREANAQPAKKQRKKKEAA